MTVPGPRTQTAAITTANAGRERDKSKPRSREAHQAAPGRTSQRPSPDLFVPLCALCVFVAAFLNQLLIFYRPKPKSIALKKRGTMSTPPMRIAAISM